MLPKTLKRRLLLLGALVALVAPLLTACAGGVAQKDYDAVQSQLKAKEQQLAQAQAQAKPAAPTTVVQAGQLQPAPTGAQPSGWDTAESIKGGLKLLATYDSSGPDAWDAKAHPLVYFTGQGGPDLSPLKKDTPFPGVQLIDAYTKEVVAAVGFDLGAQLQAFPHAVGMSPDGKWIYVPSGVGAESGNGVRGKDERFLIVNARTLKLDKVLTFSDPSYAGVHHVISFKDWQGRDRVLFGENGSGPKFLLDPNDNNRVVRAITTGDLGRTQSHPYPTVDPTGKFLYIGLEASPAAEEEGFFDGAVAKYDLEKGTFTVIPKVGIDPHGMAHTADGKFTYVSDNVVSMVFKIDNAKNTVVGRTSAGVAGPYGLALSWDETELYTVGKGEGSHNTGNVLGLIDTKTFKQKTPGFNMPINLGETARSVDHGIIHPDPAVNELWVSQMRGWTTIVLDTKSKTVKTTIPNANGGNAHSGGFVKYSADWKGEVLTDMGGPHKALYALRKEMAAKAAPAKSAPASVPAAAAAPATAATPVAAPASASGGGGAGGDLLAKGKLVFEKTAGGVGCAYCHSMDAKGKGPGNANAPDIRGKDEGAVQAALSRVSYMNFIKLTDEEIKAVAAYMKSLNQ